MSERGLFDSVLSAGAVWEATADEAWLAAMVSAEVSLAAALGKAGLIPAESGAAIAAIDPADLDLTAIGSAAAPGGNPVIPLVEALRELAACDPTDVHLGATSQDILDSSTMIIAAHALNVILDDLGDVTSRLCELAVEHATTPMIGRTLLQQALPITFGLKAANWLAGLDAAGRRLRDIRRTRLAAQLGGPVGTLQAYGSHGLTVLDLYADQLGLVAPMAPWHTERTRIGELAAGLGVLAAACATAATDLVLLAQNEVGEVREQRPGHGGSSSMAHKANPIGAVAARAAALQAPGLVATLLSASVHEHERAAGAWHAEWLPLRALLRTTGSSVWWLRAALHALVLDTGRMASNLAASGLEGQGVGCAAELVDRVVADHRSDGLP